MQPGQADQIPHSGRRRVSAARFAPRSVLVLILLCTIVEFVLFGADIGVLGSPDWRARAYEYGAFWGMLLKGGTPHFALQPITMFFSYAFLHGGLLHLGVNMVALYGFGRAIARRAGDPRFLAGYVLSAFGGAALFGLMARPDSPMVGASGALFGLVGMWICWDYLDRRHHGESNRATWRMLVYLVLYNLAFWFLLSGRLAWETHLGGFVTGWCVALWFGRPPGPQRRRRSGGRTRIPASESAPWRKAP